MKNEHALPISIGVALAGMLCFVAPGHAQEKVRVAFLRTLGMAHIWQAEKMGAFKKEGIEVEQISLNNGPAVASAVASGSADIGFSAAPPMITAISQNQPFKVLLTNSTEKAPSQWVESIVVTRKSGVKSFPELKGKTVIINAVGAACELQLRGNLAAAGMQYEDVKTIILPFPQHAAALERGDGDASCNVEPFLSFMKVGGKLDPTSVSDGMVAGMDKLGEVVIDGYFARGDWLEKNAKSAAAFKRALEAADAYLLQHVPEYRALLVAEFKLPEKVAEAITPQINARKLDAKAEQWQPVIDGMAKTGMIKTPIKASDIIFSLPQ